MTDELTALLAAARLVRDTDLEWLDICDEPDANDHPAASGARHALEHLDFCFRRYDASIGQDEADQ